jgi:NADPH:quinone reductase-like Zn-dependent oxidoreductase
MGVAAVHIAKAVGATIIATGGSDNKLQVVAAQGCVSAASSALTKMADRIIRRLLFEAALSAVIS